MSLRYDQPQALRRALGDRLKSQARATTIPLDRLRKEAAFERLLARLAAITPYGSWALKGGLAMLARAGVHARATADADTTWRGRVDQLSATLERAAAADLSDHFQFLIGSPNTLRGEGPDGGLRFPIESRLAGRTFEPIRLDINISPNDPRPIEELRLRNHFAFAGLPDVVVPAIGAPQQLAEKLHAYTRDYGAVDNTRAKDLYDMLIIGLTWRSHRSASSSMPAPRPSPCAALRGPAVGPTAAHVGRAMVRVRPRLRDYLRHIRNGLQCPAHILGTGPVRLGSTPRLAADELDLDADRTALTLCRLAHRATPCVCTQLVPRPFPGHTHASVDLANSGVFGEVSTIGRSADPGV